MFSIFALLAISAINDSYTIVKFIVEILLANFGRILAIYKLLNIGVIFSDPILNISQYIAQKLA